MIFNNHAKIDNFIEITRNRKNIFYMVINNSGRKQITLGIGCSVPRRRTAKEGKICSKEFRNGQKNCAEST